MPSYPFQQPVVTYGTAAGRANYGLDRRTTGEQDQNAINARLARQNLKDPNLDEQNRQRLQEILQEADPAVRKQAQAASLFQWQQIAKAGTDPSLGMTSSEWQQVTDAWKRNNVTSALPMPQQIFKMKKEATDPDVLKRNFAEQLGKQYNENPDSLVYQLHVDPKTGTLDQASVSKLTERLDKRQESRSISSPKNQKAVGAWGKQVDMTIKTLEKNPLLFDRYGDLRSRPSNWGADTAATVAAQNTYDQLLETYNAAIKARTTVNTMTAGFVAMNGELAADSVPDVTTEVVQPSAPAAFPKNAPYKPRPGENMQAVLEDMQAQATRSNNSVWVVLEDGTPYELKAR